LITSQPDPARSEPADTWLRALVRRRPRWVVEFVLMSVLRALFTWAAVYLIQQFLAGILGGSGGVAAALTDRWGASAALYVLAATLGGTYVLSGAVSYRGQVVEQRLIRDLEVDVVERLTRHLLSLSVDFFDRTTPGDLVVTLRQDVTKLRNVIAAQARMLFDAAQAIGLVGAAVWLSPKLAFLTLVAVPALAAPALWLSHRTLRQSFTIRQRASVMYDVLLQALRGIRVIRAFGGEAREAASATDAARRFFEASVELSRLESIGRVLVEVVAGLSIMVVVIVGGLDVLRGTITWPTLLAFLLAIRSAHAPIGSVNAQYLEAQRHGASIARIVQLLAQRPTVVDKIRGRSFPAHIESLVLDQLSFAHDGVPVLDGVALTVTAGETVGVVGRSGAGKSTLLSLLARFYDPTAGRVLVNGTDLRDISLASLYERIALVPQEPFLLSASVRENIRMGRPGASDDEIIAAASAAEIHDDIAGWPEGYDTVVGVGGRAVSEGQAQRISIARALIKDAPLLLLDEASASLDSITEARVQRALNALTSGRVAIVVAHRLSTLRHAHRIAVIDGGRVVAYGTHDELLQMSALYRDLATPQVGIDRRVVIS
jgi:ABC-type multidrug transport system fused ATPase/permease subunit